MMALRSLFWQIPQRAQVTSSRTVAGHTLTWLPAGVVKCLVVPLGSTRTTGAMPRATSLSASTTLSAERFSVNPPALAAAMARALALRAGS